MKLFFKILLFYFILISISCKKNISNKPKSKNIVLIFDKRTFEGDTIKINGIVASYKERPPISYTEENNFQKIYISTNNFSKIDTIILKPKNNIILNHEYHYYYNSTYYLKLGDTAIFKYTNDSPYLINKKKNQNIETNYNLKNKIFLSSMDFFARNKRFRNEEEENRYKILLHNNAQKKIDYLEKNKNSLDQTYYYYLKNKFFFENDNVDQNKLIINDSLLVLNSYRDYIRNYYINFYNINTLKNQAGWRINNMQAYDSINDNLSVNKKTNKYLLYYHLLEIAENFSQQDFKKYFFKFQNKINDTNIINQVKSDFLLDYIDLKKDVKNTHFIDGKGNTISMKDIIKRNKGNLIYVDFWASWCAPCRLEMPNSKKLQKEFEDKKIAFIYISIDTDKNKWIKAYKEENIIENNYLALNYPKADFYNNLKLRTIPRYMMFDTNGILIYDDAPRPSDPRLKDFFINNLQQYSNN